MIEISDRFVLCHLEIFQVENNGVVITLAIGVLKINLHLDADNCRQLALMLLGGSASKLLLKSRINPLIVRQKDFKPHQGNVVIDGETLKARDYE